MSGRLAGAWFRPRAFETRGRLYAWLGVVAFKRLLLRLARTDGDGPQPYLLAGRGPDDLRAFERRTRRNEVIHLLALVPAGAGLLAGGLENRWLAALLVLVIALNFHPFLLQRYNRGRIERVLARRAGTDRRP